MIAILALCENNASIRRMEIEVSKMQTYEMKTIEEIRRENLASLRQRFKSLREMADRLSLGEAQISQWINASKSSSSGKPRNMASDSCRLIESALGLDIGWMDHEWDERSDALRLVDLNAKHPVTLAMISLMESVDDHSKLMLYTNLKQMADLIKSATPSGQTPPISNRR
jgi:hypothetical protein